MKRKIKIGILKQKNPMKKVKQPKEYRNLLQIEKVKVMMIHKEMRKKI